MSNPPPSCYSSELDKIASTNAISKNEEPYSLDVLPPELLAYIFVFAWPKRRFAHQIPYEVQLSHVCRKWRTIALTTSILWTKISIYSPSSIKWVPSYLRRSGSRLPLSLLIDVYRWDKHRHSAGSSTMLRATLSTSVYSQLVPHLDRVRHLSIMCHHEFTAIDFQSIFSATSAPNLESINVQFDQRLPAMLLQPPPSKILMGGTPKLTFIDTPFITYFSKPNLQNVTTLFLQLSETLTLLYIEFLEALTSPTALHHLSITGSNVSLVSSWPFHRIGHDPIFQLASLKSLRIIENSMLAVKLLLSISVPQLESLWLNCSFDNFHNLFDAQQMVNATAGIGQSKFRSVQYLTIPEYNLNWVIKFSEVFPNITHLHFPHVNFFHIDLLVSALSNWKNLQSLVFTQARQSRWEKFSIALASVLEERSISSHPIKSLIMDRDFRRMLEERIPHLSDLVDVLDISPETYREPWWSKNIGNPFEHELS